jgi:hypothetical protein
VPAIRLRGRQRVSAYARAAEPNTHASFHGSGPHQCPPYVYAFTNVYPAYVLGGQTDTHSSFHSSGPQCPPYAWAFANLSTAQKVPLTPRWAHCLPCSSHDAAYPHIEAIDMTMCPRRARKGPRRPGSAGRMRPLAGQRPSPTQRKRSRARAHFRADSKLNRASMRCRRFDRRRDRLKVHASAPFDCQAAIPSTCACSSRLSDRVQAPVDDAARHRLLIDS